MSEEIDLSAADADATRRWVEHLAELAETRDPGGGTDSDDFLGEDDDGFLGDLRTEPGVNVRLLHPELRARLTRAFADSRLANSRVVSGVRTYEHQKRLYAQYGPGRAANPDYRGPNGRRGSNHMAQDATWTYAPKFPPGNYGYAVDIGYPGTPQDPKWQLLRDTMGEYGLRLTVFRPFEPWHFELDPATAGSSATATVFRMGVSGSGTKELQEFLTAQHKNMPNTIPDLGEADGIFGDKTRAAIAAWQAYLGQDNDGIWGPATEGATGDWRAKREATVKNGDTGDLVKEIQTYLGACHKEHAADVPDPGDADGTFGDNTQKATSGWQSVLKIDDDGMWGPSTWKASDHYDDAAKSS